MLKNILYTQISNQRIVIAAVNVIEKKLDALSEKLLKKNILKLLYTFLRVRNFCTQDKNNGQEINNVFTTVNNLNSKISCT